MLVKNLFRHSKRFKVNIEYRYLTANEKSKYHTDAVIAGKDFLITYHAAQLKIINKVNSQNSQQFP